MKKEKIEKLILAVIVVCGVIYAYVTYLFLPKWAELKTGFQQLAARKVYYQALVQYQKNLPDLQQKLKTVEEQAQKAAVLIPARLDKPQIMVDLYTIAKQRGVYPQSVTFDQPQNKGYYQELGMNFTCLGKTEDILNMIQDLRQTTKEKLALQSVNLTSQQGLMRAELKLIGYAIPQTSGDTPGQKPDFMNVPFGISSYSQMFQ